MVLVRPGVRPADLAVAAYFAVAAAVALLPGLTGITHGELVDVLAFSPSDLLSGRLWELPLSGVVVDGDTWPQLALLLQTAVVLVAMAGARTFWRAAIAAHIGSTLIAYGLLAGLELADPRATGDLFTDPDYGVSCVWAGCVGALAVVAARRSQTRVVRAGVATAVTASLVLLLGPGFVTPAGTLRLATLEHALALLLGAWVARRGSAAKSAQTSKVAQEQSVAVSSQLRMAWARAMRASTSGSFRAASSRSASNAGEPWSALRSRTRASSSDKPARLATSSTSRRRTASGP